MRNKLFFRMIVCAALAIGLVLAGCDTGTNGDGTGTENTGGNGGNGDNPGGNGGNNGGNTGGNGNNSQRRDYTLKMAPAGDNTFTVTISGGGTWEATLSNINQIDMGLELDGDVDWPTGGTRKLKISDPGSIGYSPIRESDTVIRVIMSQHSPWEGKGKLKLKANQNALTDSFGFYIDKKGNTWAFDTLTVASNSQSISFHIPWSQW
ncbi:MAG: hypothetical protein LBF74_02595 [Treponema sp.]|jgi:hypothetical protein|nr:hypothetical protein [Treponema sp.]